MKIYLISLKKFISEGKMQFFQTVFSLFVRAVTNNVENFWKKKYFSIHFWEKFVILGIKFNNIFNFAVPLKFFTTYFHFK
jgi:hypothetical protein